MRESLVDSPLLVGTFRSTIVRAIGSMLVMTQELCDAVNAAGERPLRVVEPRTQQTYVVMREDIFERVKSFFVSEDNPEAFYPLLADLSPEDWENGSVYGLPESQ